jgi:NAD(P)-dependent dehydrogenase (short-subunit alcohol dehydrogenase family)
MARVATGTPMRRLGSAADVVEAVLFLAGPGSGYISGTVLPVDGGMAASRI